MYFYDCNLFFIFSVLPLPKNAWLPLIFCAFQWLRVVEKGNVIIFVGPIQHEIKETTMWGGGNEKCLVSLDSSNILLKGPSP